MLHKFTANNGKFKNAKFPCTEWAETQATKSDKDCPPYAQKQNCTCLGLIQLCQQPAEQICSYTRTFQMKVLNSRCYILHEVWFKYFDHVQDLGLELQENELIVVNIKANVISHRPGQTSLYIFYLFILLSILPNLSSLDKPKRKMRKPTTHFKDQ